MRAVSAVGIIMFAVAGCTPSAPQNADSAADTPSRATAAALVNSNPTVEGAIAFISEAEARLAEEREYGIRAAWVHANFITPDTTWLLARADSQFTELSVRLANETKRFERLDLPDEIERKMNILRTGITIPVPSTPGAAGEIAGITAELASSYATGHADLNGETVGLDELEQILDRSRDPQLLAKAWAAWRTIARPMADSYARMIELASAGAKELGFSDLAEMWLSTYGMSAADMEAEVERLWGQVKPLYEELHCHVRAELSDFYGENVQADQGLIRADLLGNMWAQQWSNIYDLVAPAQSTLDLDLTTILQESGYTERKMIETGEAFFTSLGLAPLADSFWEQSLIKQPADRVVECHASAWDIDQVDDLRIKMCTQINAEDFQTVHHELGHSFYSRAYARQDFLFRDGAHDGFHEAIGDFVALSITPEYLQRIGLIEDVPDADADIGLLMQQALDKIAFLPFGLLVDKWRWQVLRGTVGPAQYNDAWWELRRQYQGVEPPVARGSGDFDPGAKFHIPGNTPYLRYFLAFILQFQFHEAACEMAGWEGALHRCSIYGNEAVGERLNAMLELGASVPWPVALATFTGQRQMDATAIIKYFEPLMGYLKERNEARQCGW